MKKISLSAIFALGVGIGAHAQNTCSTALPVVSGNVYTISVINGTEVPQPVCAPGGNDATSGMWYAYTPTADFNVTVSTDLSQNNGIDTRVHVYSGTCGNLTCIGGDDDSGTDLLSVFSFVADAGQTYYIAFDDQWEDTGFDFELTENTPPPAPLVTATSQSVPINGSYKIAIADMNGDYLDDIVAVSSTVVNVKLQQLDGSFVDQSYPTPGAQNLPTWSMAIADYNKDGQNDLLYGSGNGVSFMYSTPTGYQQFFVTNYVFSQRSNFVDLNNDGNLDAFVCHDVAPNVYYINDGNGNLTFYQGGIGDHPNGGNYGSIFIDFDNDGDQDLFIAKCRGGAGTAKLNEMHMNNGDGTFTNISNSANMNHPNQSWSSAWNDFDNDGDLDAVIGASSFSDGGHLFMRNNGDGTFTDVAAGSGLDQYTGLSIEYVSYDFNNDGWADVFTNGKMLINNGDMTFTVQDFPANVGAVGDLNNDGFMDVQNGNTVYYVTPNNNNWVKLNLLGNQSNIQGIGARVEIYGVWGKQIRDVQSGIGFRHMGTMNPHFGIGQATEIDSIVVRWPSGKVDMICNPAINETHFLEEGNGDVPIADFSASATMITAGESVEFTDATTVCPNLWTWSVAPATGWEFINGTNANSLNPEIQFNNSGTYVVTLIASNSNGDSQAVTETINAASAAGIEENNSFEMSLFPNPANAELNISINAPVAGAKIRVVSTLGTVTITEIDFTEVVDIRHLATGIYFLEVELPNGMKQTQRFVKE